MFIDLSHPISNQLLSYPGDPKTSLYQSNTLQDDGFTNHILTINMHAGTHIDGPMHLLHHEPNLSEFSLDSFIGPACLINVKGKDVIDYAVEYEMLIQEGQIIVLYTGHDQIFNTDAYYEKHPIITMEFAQLLIRKQVKMVCIDFPSPDIEPYLIHKILFEHHILIAENLTNLSQLIDKIHFDIVALPLAIQADSSPARIIAIVRT